MDKNNTFAERRERQKEKLMAQRAERRMTASTAADRAIAKPSSNSEVARADSPGSSEGIDDAFVHVDKADATGADISAASPGQSSLGSGSNAAQSAPASSPVKRSAPSPTECAAMQIIRTSPTRQTMEAMEKLQMSPPDATEKPQARVPTATSTAAASSPQMNASEAAQPSLSKERSAAPSLRQRPTEEAPIPVKDSQRASNAQLDAGDVRKQKLDHAEQASPEGFARERHGNSERNKPGKGTAKAEEEAAGPSWGWGKSWLPTAVLQQVAAGALKDVQEMKDSLQQAFAAEDSEAITDEKGRARKQGPQGSSSEAERRAVLERLQGEDNPLAAGFKLLDKQIDTVLGGAAGLAGSLFGRAHTAGRQVVGRVEAGLELFGQSAIRLLDGGMDYSRAPQNTFASHFHKNGGSDLAEEVEELCNDSARLCNRLRSVLKGAELEGFNADVAGMAAYLDTNTLSGSARIDVSPSLTAPGIDTLIIEATCRRGAERLKGWHDRQIDGFALWGLHHDACTQLAEAVALCVEALHTFGIELSGSAAPLSESQPATGAFISIADLLQFKVRAMVAALSQLTDAYLAVADKAAAEVLAAFTAQQGSASNAASSQAGAREMSTAEADAASQAPSSSAPQDFEQATSGVKQDVAQRYPNHVHDPLKVQLELGKVKGAALQCVTELYRGLLYVVLYYCHRQRKSSTP